MLYLYQGNQLERLADQLSSDLSQFGDNILAPELIAVPGRSVSSWLSLHLAQTDGVIANIDFLLPAELLWRIFRIALPDVPTSNAFSAEALTWRIFSVLCDESFVKAHEPLSHYLKSHDPRQSWQLALRLGHLYEQYLIYRPDWICRWERGSSTDWQAVLWRRLIADGNDRHWLNLQKDLLNRLSNSEPITNLPSRVSLFALPILSPAYLELLQVLSNYVDILFYHLNFSKGYWTEIVSEKERARFLVTEGQGVDRYLETGNPLLAMMGKQSREQLVGLLQLEAVESEVFQLPPNNTVLSCIQKDILHLRERTDADRFELTREDTSLQVHICHSELREVEILHDQLQHLFQNDPTLEPADVLVLAPDINDYASHIDAVFGTAAGNRYIPWHSVVQALATEGVLIETFFALLELPFSRFEVDQVLSLLDIPLVCHRFGLDEVATEQIQNWIMELGVCWGVQDTDADVLNANTGGKHTWRSGLDRLLLGHAFGDTGNLFGHILPYAPLDVNEAIVVGRLETFLQQLIEVRRDLSGPWPIGKWIELANAILDQFFLPQDVDESEMYRLRAHIREIGEVSVIAGYRGELPLTVFRDVLKSRLIGGISGQFMSGLVTFGTLAQGSCVPARVVCLLGMNNDAFPRRDIKHSFNKILTHPRPRDKRRRDEDRHLFLECLIAAREYFYISYVGRDLHSDRENPPSVVVCELLNYVDSICKTEINVRPSRELTTLHLLHSFSTAYFDNSDKKLFSYAVDLLPPENISLGSSKPLLPKRLPAFSAEAMPLEMLPQFFVNPARMLLRDRLRIRIEGFDWGVSAHEPINIDYFAERDIAEAALNALYAGESLESFHVQLRATGKIPAGTSGDLLLDRLWRDALNLMNKLQVFHERGNLQQVKLDTEVRGVRLQAQFNSVIDDGLICHVIGIPNSYDLLKFWISHLGINMLEGGLEGDSQMLTLGDSFRFHSVVDAREVLEELISIYFEGMARPIAFFPRAAWAYMKTSGDRCRAANNVWQGSEYHIGEGDNMYYRLAFREVWDRVLTGEFGKLADKVYGPLLEHLVKTST